MVNAVTSIKVPPLPGLMSDDGHLLQDPTARAGPFFTATRITLNQSRAERLYDHVVMFDMKGHVLVTVR